jgi:colanic acid biosynthesis glycosyl transferase WcaI
MRILIVSQYYQPEPLRIGDLAVWLAARGHGVSVLTGQPNYPEGRFYAGYGPIRPLRETIDGVTVHRVPLLPRGNAGTVALAANYLSFALSGACLGPLLARGSFDVVMCFLVSPITAALPGIVMSRLRRAPLVLWVQDLWPESVATAGKVDSPVLLRCLDRLVRFIYRRADAIWIQSRAFAPAVLRYGVAPERVAYVPNSSESHYRPDAGGRAAAPGRLSILYAGNIGDAQGFETIIDAVALTSATQGIDWTFVGDGRRRAWLETEIERRGLARTRILARVPPERMPALIATADALLVPLRRAPVFALTIPSKLQSAFASGRPVLAVLEGEGARLVDESGAGIVAAPGDARALAQAVIRLAATGPEERQRMAMAGRRYHEANFEREQVYALIEQNLESIARSGG